MTEKWRADAHMSEPSPFVSKLEAAAADAVAAGVPGDADLLERAATEIKRLRDNLQAIADRGFCEEFGCLECKSVRVAVMALEWEPGQVAT